MIAQSDAAAGRSAHVWRQTQTVVTNVQPAGPVVEVAPGQFQLRAIAERDAEIERLRAALRPFVENLHVETPDAGLLKGKLVLYGGPVGARACLCIAGNSWWEATLNHIGGMLEQAKEALR